MTKAKKFLALCLTAILLMVLAGCSGYAPSITPKPAEPTISENVSTLQKNGYRITSTRYYNVVSITTEDGMVVSTHEQEAPAGKIAVIRLRSASGDTVRVTDPHIVANLDSGIRVGQRCAYVKGLIGTANIQLNFIVFGSNS